MSELLGRSNLMAIVAQASDVAVVVAPTHRQRDDVVGCDRRCDNAAIGTITAQWFLSKSTQALSDRLPTTQPRCPLLSVALKAW
jgi:hypothetical protein